MISLSTAWLPERGWPLEQVFDTLAVFDLASLELNYRVHPLDIEATQQQLKKRGYSIVSLHNICSSSDDPSIADDHYGDSIASLDEATRQTAATRLKETAEAARALNARGIVVHGGRVAAAKASPVYGPTMKQATKANDPDIVRERLPELLEERSQTAPLHVAQLIKSLNEVCPLFPDIQFGLENRYHFHSLPSFDELETIISEVKSDNVGYWHDCGHGQVQENLGICRHEDWLKRYQDKLIGVHLHGMKNRLLDHQAPTKDNMDFEMIRRYTKAGTLLVIEANASNDVHAMIAGKQYLESVFGA